MMQYNKLEILHLTKRFGEKTLFEDLNLTVEEPAVLWAPSGWGKTTLLRVLMGLETPTSGSVQGVGRVSAVFQEDRLCPQLNAVQNVALVLPGLEIQYKEQIEICFQQLGLDSTALVLPARKLSGGQKRRVALLRALLAPSDTLLLDEPFTGMDPETLQKVKAEFEKRAEERATAHRSAVEALEGKYTAEIAALGERLNGSERETLAARQDAERIAAEAERLGRERTLQAAEINALKKECGRFTDEDSFTSREQFEELERQYKVFKDFFRAEWKKTKKKIRAELLRPDGDGDGKDGGDGE